MSTKVEMLASLFTRPEEIGQTEIWELFPKLLIMWENPVGKASHPVVCFKITHCFKYYGITWTYGSHLSYMNSQENYLHLFWSVVQIVFLKYGNLKKKEKKFDSVWCTSITEVCRKFLLHYLQNRWWQCCCNLVFSQNKLVKWRN